MDILIYLVIALGLFEIISNLFHFTKGTKSSIGNSAKRQHQELSLDLDSKHFYLKAIIMFVFGILLLATGSISLIYHFNTPLLISLSMFALYGFAQAVYYLKPYKVWLSLVVYLLPLIALLLLTSELRSETIEQTGSFQPFVFPFSLSIEPIKYLIVIDYTDDTEYESIEPQLFDDPKFGKGLRVLLYRKDKLVDVYWQPGVNFDSSSFKIGDGLGHTKQTIMSPAKFEITNRGVDLDIAFMDANNRKIEIKIKENTTSNSRFSFLAPVGKDIMKPNKLFLAYMKEFDFVRKTGTFIQAKIGDRVLKPESFPITRDWKKVYFARYASRLVIGQINSTLNSPLIADLKKGDNFFDNYNVHLNQENTVSNISIMYDSSKVELEFESGFPNLRSLKNNTDTKGKWNYLVSGLKIIGGNYSLKRSNNIVDIEFDVSDKWKPKDLPFSFKIFTLLNSSFKTWPTTYKWEAKLELETYTMKSEWKRK